MGSRPKVGVPYKRRVLQSPELCLRSQCADGDQTPNLKAKMIAAPAASKMLLFIAILSF
jgi:hypothetical protein